MLKQEIVARALAEIGKGYAQYQYFFDHLNSPTWLEPLANRGFFRQPPPPKYEGNYVQFQWWPESRYLVRMAHILDAQEIVLEIVLRIPDSENSRVHDDIADVALSLPPALSVKLVPQVCRYIESPVKVLLAEKIANLIVHLAQGGEGKGALLLTSAALALTSDPRRADRDGEEPRHIPDPQPRFRDWYYGRIIQKALPVLVEAVGLGAVDLFCALLNDAARFSCRENESEDEDYFYIRHPAIEHGTSRGDIPSLLLCANRDAAIQVISRDPDSFDPVLSVLRQGKWTSFRRLEFYICRLFPQQGIAIAERIWEDPKVLDRPSLTHEAVRLLKASFSKVSAERQRQILAWMDAGPPTESIRKWLELVGESVSDENVEKVRRIRRRNRLSMIEGQLPEPYMHTYEQLKAALGEPPDPERLPIRTFSQVGVQSPKSVAELEAMEVDGILEFLTSWTPGSDFLAPTAEGLGATLTSVVSKRPSEFVAVAQKFKALDPTYVRCLFAGLNKVLQSGEKLDWGPVLELATWVTTQPREIEGRKGGLMVADPDWGWTRDSIIDLLNVGFAGGADRLPYEHRKLVWKALASLTDDPFPSLKDEEGEKFDPSFLSINSTRGRALHASFAYAEWARNCVEAHPKSAELKTAALSAMPELREVLDRHLELNHEPTLTIRSVYGQHLAWLAALDWEWFRTNLARILPLDQNRSTHFSAAWESFVVFNPPNNALLRELLPSYQRAVAQIQQGPRLLGSPASPLDSLADHLMTYYWRGDIEFGGLIDDFYTEAPDQLRGHAMWFTGRSVSGWDNNAPPQVFERLQSLMERRLELAETSASPDTFAKELANFGWWFTSSKFSDRWSIETLLRTLRLTEKTEDEMNVVKCLAELCPKYPIECLSCFRLMVEGDRERWLLVGVEDDARRMIKLVLKSNRPAAVDSARRLIEDLIARSHFGFRNLVEQK